MVKITGVIYTARDAAHKRMFGKSPQGIALPVDLKDQTIYFAGPAPAKPNESYWFSSVRLLATEWTLFS